MAMRQLAVAVDIWKNRQSKMTENGKKGIMSLCKEDFMCDLK
jgi:hypothetical protein